MLHKFRDFYYNPLVGACKRLQTASLSATGATELLDLLNYMAHVIGISLHSNLHQIKSLLLFYSSFKISRFLDHFVFGQSNAPADTVTHRKELV